MTVRFPVSDYDLAATLGSGQVFRWQEWDGAWEGILGGQWFRLRQIKAGNGGGHDVGVEADAVAPVPDWQLLRRFLRLDDNLTAIRSTFPGDEPMQTAVQACPGLRLLRQEPWECLASFILSSTKRIVQIQQCVALLCERFGEPVAVPPGRPAAFQFPSAEALAAAGDSELRACRLGFRAPYLAGSARAVAQGRIDLEGIDRLSTAEAREHLVALPGVGRKIADCVLLFAYGRQDAFPVDVWVRRALSELYFPNRRPSSRVLEQFAATHFGPNAGYAQQYLFHYVRTHLGRRGLGPVVRRPGRRTVRRRRGSIS